MLTYYLFTGTFDLFPCTGAPMIGSHPHFYGADPSILNSFESGIKPNKEKHAIYSFMEGVSVFFSSVQ